MGLASIYKKYALQGEGGREASKQISWIKDKLLHIYYQNSIDDRFVFMNWNDLKPTSTLMSCCFLGLMFGIQSREGHCFVTAACKQSKADSY